MIKKIGQYIILGLILIIITIGGIFINRYHKLVQVRDIKTNIVYGEAGILLTPTEIEALVYKNSGDIKGKTMEEISLSKIENVIMKNPFVSKAHVYADLKGNVHIDITQREPIVRIKDMKGNQFYLDKDGYRMPLSTQGSSHVLIVSGYIASEKMKTNTAVTLYEEEKKALKSASGLEKIFYLAHYMYRHPFFKNQIDQVYVTKKGEFELTPKVGTQTILLGGIDRLDTKLENLFYLYKDGFSNTGWDIYKTINLTFENQIVCTKY